MVIVARIKVKPLRSKLRNDLERFEEKVIVEEETGCWLWTGTKAGGYPLFRHDKHNYAHRFAYETYKGRLIPAGLEVDHTCDDSRCVNPDHLEAVTQEENILRRRKDLLGSGKRASSECVSGHPYTESSYYVNRHGHRICRECQRMRDARKRAKTKSNTE